MKTPTKDGIGDLPERVFEEFLDALADAGASEELVEQLRKTLLVEQNFTERALKAAVMPEEPLP